MGTLVATWELQTIWDAELLHGPSSQHDREPDTKRTVYKQQTAKTVKTDGLTNI